MKRLSLLVGLSLSCNLASAAIQIDTFASSIPVTSLGVADNLISGVQIPIGTGTALSTVVDHFDGSGGTGHFANDLAIPGGFTTNFAYHATCLITIPTTGLYTFGINSDDGARLRINGLDIIVDDSLHATQDIFSTAPLTLIAGVYPLDLVFFEFDGGASVELFATTGSFAAFDASMRLVGDTANGGLTCNSVVGATGTVTITDSVPGGNITVTVTDADLNTNPALVETIVVTVVNDVTGESENVTLTETGPNTGIFAGPLGTIFGVAAGANNDGTLNTQASDTVTVTYDDALDASGADPIAITSTGLVSAAAVATAIPTISMWGLILMSGLLGLMGLFGYRKKT